MIKNNKSMGRRNLQSLKSLVKHLIFIVLIVLGATGAWAQTPTRILDDIPVGWTVTADGVEVTVTPYYTGSPLGSAIIPEGVEVVLTPPDSVKPRVKDVELLLPEQIPLTFEAKMAGAVVSFGRYYPDSPQPATVTIEYSKNGGEWTTYTSSITLDYVGDKVYFRGNNTTYYLNMFYCSGDCYLYGNIMSLISSEDYATATALTESYAFAGLFSLNSDIYNHASKKLVLPATTLSSGCYSNMFNGCTGLTAAPALPAMTMTPHCYQGMFDGCSSLTTAPALPATTLATQCYNGMFSNCTSLATAPALPATTLAGFCYDGMFSGDTSLTTAPVLPAETLSPNCYQYMFMGCKNLNSVTCLATNISATNCTTDWLDNVAATGTFYKPASMTDWLMDNPSGIPPGWTVISDGALPGEFTVNADGRKVNFSQGNLQYQASTNTWRFAEHQYDYVGDATHGNVYENEVKCDNANISSTYSGWIDLFGWATSGNGSSGTAYQPWSTSTTNSDYGPAISSGEWTAANSDWGVVNAAQLGSGWRTLTHSEWAFLINSRTNASNLRTFATVNGVVGLILMPDGWTANGVSLTITTNNYTSNNLSLAQWSTLESQGCVFLPSDGYRGGNNGTTLDLVQDHGSYWSSTAASGNTPHAYYLDVKTSGLDPNYQNNRHIGLSVRLVSETYFVGSGTEADPYIIHSEADWNYLAAKVNSGTNYAGKFFRQTADIDVTTMVGISDSKPFSGTYNGDGKTLNLNLSTSESHSAPFRYIVDATIQNVVTTGSVYSTSYHPSGLVGITDGTCTIQNCRVSANVGGPQYLGGIVGHCWHADISIIGCVYTGTLNPANGQKTGGILGWGGDGGGHTITISNCLFAGSLANASTNFNPIGSLYEANNTDNTKNLSNTYYTLGANTSDEDINSFVKGLSYKGKFARSITAGTDVTVANAGAATVYDVSGITSYGTGILYDGVLYAGNGEAVSLSLSHADAPESFFFTQYTVTGGGTLANPTTNSPTLTMTDANQTINVEWAAITQTFNYTGAVQTFTVPATGYYTLECYGAQGGSCSNGLGGKGGLSQLTYLLTQGDVLYIYVGGQGGSLESGFNHPDGGDGGWNGGGKGGTGVAWGGGNGEPYNGGGGGGGATHIATSAMGPITGSTDFTDNNTGLLLIAGGGGGGLSWGPSAGGAGGGTEGGKGHRGDSEWNIAWNNGTLSCGRDGMTSSNGAGSCEGCGGGGGGYQGGTTWTVSYNASNQSYSGAGGSSWGETTNGKGYSTTAGGATAGGNGKAVITWYGTTYPSE